MARAATTFDVFNAIAEARRRDLLTLLANGRLAVNEIIARLGWPQPMVSKHLGVLRQVGLVRVEAVSRQKFYSLEAAPLKNIHQWTQQFEPFWDQHLQGIKARAEAKTKLQRKSQLHRKEPK